MISIIVPVYKVEPYLNRCIESIVNQSYSDLEIILVDDGSPDNCGNICDVWEKRDSRIKVIHKENGGLSDARNVGIEISAGDYIGFVDGDDWIEKDMYQDLLTGLESSFSEIAVTGINRVYEGGYKHTQFVHEAPFSMDNKEIIEKYLRQGTFSTAACDKLYIRSLFEKRRFPVGRLYEDAPVVFDILCAVKRMYVVGKPQYNYYQRSDSICGQIFSEGKMDHYIFSKDIRDRVKKEYPELELASDVFWGCKLCEILYTLYESPNRAMFPKEKKLLYSDFRSVWRTCMKDSSVPNLMKMKLWMAHIRCIPAYNFVKKALLKKG